jgi:hypothetical protein
LERAL